jgi:hypothetical protein
VQEAPYGIPLDAKINHLTVAVCDNRRAYHWPSGVSYVEWLTGPADEKVRLFFLSAGILRGVILMSTTIEERVAILDKELTNLKQIIQVTHRESTRKHSIYAHVALHLELGLRKNNACCNYS